MRIVLDINVLVSGIIAKDSPPGQLLALWRDRKYHLILSADMIDRLGQVLVRPALRRFVEPAEASALIHDLRDAAIIVDPLPKLDLVSDREDNVVLATAIAGQVDMLVTGDKKHLLPLGHVQGIPIHEPRVAVALVLPPSIS